ncbi:MAG: ribonuclease, partial [Duncaniella sp.]|nr:ribonuclease [Duncaniella sp.]
IFLSDDPNATSGIEEIASDAEQLVNVVNMQGVVVRNAVPVATATEGLPAGLYIVGNKKVLVRN